MKVCKICGSSYDDRVDFCFRDGTPLGRSVAPPVSTAASPEPAPAPQAADAGVEAPPAVPEAVNPLPFGVMTSLPGPGRRGAPVVRHELTDLPAPGTTPEIELPDPEVDDSDETTASDLPDTDMLTPAVELEAADLPTVPMDQPHLPGADASPAVSTKAVELATPVIEPRRVATDALDEELEPPAEIAAPSVDLALLPPVGLPAPRSDADTVPLPHPRWAGPPEREEEEAQTIPMPRQDEAPPGENTGVVPPHVTDDLPAPPPKTGQATPVATPQAAPPTTADDDDLVVPPPRSRTGLYIGVVVVLLAAAGGAVALLGKSPKPAEIATVNDPVAPPAPPAPSPPPPIVAAPPSDAPIDDAVPTEVAPTQAPPAVATAASAPPATPATTPVTAAPATTNAATAAPSTARAAAPSAAATSTDNPWTAATAATQATTTSPDDPWGAGGTAATQSGTVSVVSVPAGAKVYVDDQAKGQTPTKVELAYGLHTVRLELDGHQSSARSVQLGSETSSVSFELSPVAAVGQVNLFGPPGAEVFADGKALGKLPATGRLSEGSHTFKVVAPDGTEFSKTVQVQFSAPGQPAIISLAGP